MAMRIFAVVVFLQRKIIFESFCNLQVKFTPWRKISWQEFYMIFLCDNFHVELKNLHVFLFISNQVAKCLTLKMVKS